MKKNIKEKSKGFIGEFKTFIQKGNAFDLAIAVIIGNAFGKIVSSLVDDIIMPLLSSILNQHSFTDLSFNIGNATVKYGVFIQNIVDFLIIAFCIFVFIKLFNNIFKKEETKKEEKIVKKEEVILLEEIRDLLKK